jgi:hypothetical protein
MGHGMRDNAKQESEGIVAWSVLPLISIVDSHTFHSGHAYLLDPRWRSFISRGELLLRFTEVPFMIARPQSPHHFCFNVHPASLKLIGPREHRFQGGQRAKLATVFGSRKQLMVFFPMVSGFLSCHSTSSPITRPTLTLAREIRPTTSSFLHDEQDCYWVAASPGYSCPGSDLHAPYGLTRVLCQQRLHTPLERRLPSNGTYSR